MVEHHKFRAKLVTGSTDITII